MDSTGTIKDIFRRTKSAGVRTLYHSITSGNECNCPQYLAELMCVRQAKLKHEPIQVAFWNTDRWRKTYRLQIIKANALLRTFPEQAIISALHTKQGEKIWSLYWKNIVELIIIEDERLRREAERLERASKNEITEESVEFHAKTDKTKQFGKKSNLDKLKELDGED